MVASNYAGSGSKFGQLLSDVDVSGREFEKCLGKVDELRLDLREHGYTRLEAIIAAARAAQFFEAVASCNRAAADTVLRRWGIRR